MPLSQRKHPALEGLRHSLDWVWGRIGPVNTFETNDLLILERWMTELKHKIATKRRALMEAPIDDDG